MASIEKRTRNGKTSYRVRYRDPVGAQRSQVFTRKVDAQRWSTENENDKLRGAWIDPAAGRMLFAEQTERWFATKAVLRHTTQRDYRKLLDQQVLPRFGEVPLADVSMFQVREWLTKLVADGLSAKRAGKAHAVLSQVLASAVEEGRLARNVAAGIRKPKAQRAEMLFLTAAQIEALAEAIRGPYEVLIRFMAYSGLRPAEVTALRIRHLDLLRGTIRVVEGAPEVDGHLIWGGVKTHEARTVHLPRSVAEQVGASLANRSHGPDDLAFAAPMGGPLRFSKWIDNYFKPALRAAGLPEALRPYDLRHTCASLLIREGASIKAVQAQLGHSTPTMTLNTYAHLFPDELPALAERLEAARTAALAELGSGRVWPQRGPAAIGSDKSAVH
jgi:integrase